MGQALSSPQNHFMSYIPCNLLTNSIKTSSNTKLDTETAPETSLTSCQCRACDPTIKMTMDPSSYILQTTIKEVLYVCLYSNDIALAYNFTKLLPQ